MTPLLPFLLLFAAADAPGVPITVINYANLPVHATAVALDEAELDAKLGVPAGTPLRVCYAEDRMKSLPITRGAEDDRPVVRLYLALPPTTRLELLAQRADRWPDERLAAATKDDMYNGVVRVMFGPKGWNFGFAPATSPGDGKLTIVEDGQLDFWIDRENRGRITNAEPKYLAGLGLLHYADTRVENCSAAVDAAGRPSVRIVRRFDGFAKKLSVIETFELVPGMPILICRIRWQNDGDAPLYVAYVGSGTGTSGRWSKRLMPGPLIERKKSPLLGDLGGGETRCAWLGGICRISMESPALGCGVGLSTLLATPGKVGQGSMVWGCGSGGFQCNLIDPVQGQLPHRIEPHGPLDNGFAFLATQTGTSVFRQTVEMWSRLASGKLPRLASPSAVFVDGQPVHAQTIAALPDDPRLLVETDKVRRAAVRIDLNKFYECRVDVAKASSHEPAIISARPMAPGKRPVEILRADKPGQYVVNLNERLGKADEIAIVLETTPGVSHLTIVETLPTAPRMLSPVDDARLTDLAVMYRWESIPMVVDYDVQWSRSADFADARQTRVTTSQQYAWYLPPDEKLPAPGKWHWRVRGVKGDLLGQWSPVRTFTVDADHAPRPLRRPLTAESPLFTLEATRVLDFTQFRPNVPADVAPYVGIVAEGFEAKGMLVTDFARGMDRLPHAILLRSHWVGLGDIEWLFQHVPNFVGIQGGEHLSSLYRGGRDGETLYHHRLTRLCAKYGMFYQEADGTYKDDKWQELMDRQGPFVREFGQYLVLSQKNNIIRRQFYSQSAALGLWLGGITHQHGAWEDGGFYWQNAGFRELGSSSGERTGVLATMPRIFWDLVFVMGVSRGCGIYSLDGQTLMYSPKEAERRENGPPKAAIWDTTGRTSDTFRRFVLPLIRGVVRHRLVPTKAEVLANVRLAVYNDHRVPGDERAWPHYMEYGPLYAATYGFRTMGNISGQLWEFFPNSGRYYYIPVLPQGNQPLGPNVRNLPVSALQDPAAVRRVFDAAYPAWYEGDALVTRVGDTLTILNSRENEDVTECYAVPLAGATVVTRLSGKIGPHAYLVGKLEDRGRRFWLQANTEYPERDTVLVLACPAKPRWQIDPPAAAKEATWNEAAKTLSLRLSHGDGAVEVTVE